MGDLAFKVMAAFSMSTELPPKGSVVWCLFVSNLRWCRKLNLVTTAGGEQKLYGQKTPAFSLHCELSQDNSSTRHS